MDHVVAHPVQHRLESRELYWQLNRICQQVNLGGFWSQNRRFPESIQTFLRILLVNLPFHV